MAVKSKTPVENTEPSYKRIEKTGKAWREGWSWLIIPILKNTYPLMVAILAIILQKVFNIDIAVFLNLLTGVSKLLKQ